MATYPDSDYPAAPDSDIPVLDATSHMDTTSHWRLHNAVRSSILAIQGVLGTNPQGPFATVKAWLTSLERRVSPTFHVDDYGAVGDGVTDDTAAFYAAAAAGTSAGVVHLKLAAKTYLLDGSLVTTQNGYAIFALPTGRAPVTIEGVAPANNCDPLTDGGKYSIIKVTKTGLTRSGTYGVPSVIGGPTDSTWAENMVVLKNFCLWLPKNPTIAGIDLRHVRRFMIDGVSVQAINTGDTDFTDPTSVYAFGIRNAEPNNYNACLIRNAQVHGMYASLVGTTESLTIEYLVAKWCKIGWGIAPGGHGASVQKLDISWCPYAISGWSETAGVTSVQTGVLGETEAQVSISYMAIEDYAGSSKWYDPVNHLNDPTNRVKGVIFYDYYLLGTGVGSTFTKNGGTGVTAISLRSPSFGTSGSSLTVQDENGTVATGVTQLDFQGAQVSATPGTGEVVVTVTGDGVGGSGSSAELVMQDGVASPPAPLESEDGTDWLYTD